MTVKNIRANGVNTPVMVIDAENKAHLPLLVQYPVERNGAFGRLNRAYLRDPSGNTVCARHRPG